METFFLKLSVNKWPLKLIAQFLWMLLLSVNPQHHCDTDNVLVGISFVKRNLIFRDSYFFSREDLLICLVIYQPSMCECVSVAFLYPAFKNNN